MEFLFGVVFSACIVCVLAVRPGTTGTKAIDGKPFRKSKLIKEENEFLEVFFGYSGAHSLPVGSPPPLYVPATKVLCKKDEYDHEWLCFDSDSFWTPGCVSVENIKLCGTEVAGMRVTQTRHLTTSEMMRKVSTMSDQHLAVQPREIQELAAKLGKTVVKAQATGTASQGEDIFLKVTLQIGNLGVEDFVFPYGKSCIFEENRWRCGDDDEKNLCNSDQKFTIAFESPNTQLAVGAAIVGYFVDRTSRSHSGTEVLRICSNIRLKSATSASARVVGVSDVRQMSVDRPSSVQCDAEYAEAPRFVQLDYRVDHCTVKMGKTVCKKDASYGVVLADLPPQPYDGHKYRVDLSMSGIPVIQHTPVGHASSSSFMTTIRHFTNTNTAVMVIDGNSSYLSTTKHANTVSVPVHFDRKLKVKNNKLSVKVEGDSQNFRVFSFRLEKHNALVVRANGRGRPFPFPTDSLYGYYSFNSGLYTISCDFVKGVTEYQLESHDKRQFHCKEGAPLHKRPFYGLEFPKVSPGHVTTHYMYGGGRYKFYTEEKLPAMLWKADL